MKSRSILTRRLWVLFFAFVSVIRSADNESLLVSMRTQAEWMIRSTLGEKELSYNTQVKTFRQICHAIEKKRYTGKSMLAVTQQNAQEYRHENPSCYTAVLNCGVAHHLYYYIKQYNAQLIETLCMIDEALSYWYSYQHHPFYSFTQRYPTQWLNHSPFHQSIGHKIEQLLILKDYYCQSLGMSYAHTLLLEKHEKPDDILPLVKEGLHIIMGRHTQEALKYETIEEYIPQLQLFDAYIEQYAAKQRSLLVKSELSIPSYVQRNWMIYSGIGLCTFAGMWYLAAHHEKINHIKETISIMRSEMVNDLKRPLKGFQEAFMQNTHGKQARVIELGKNLDTERKLFVKQAMNYFPHNEFNNEQREHIRKNLTLLKTHDITNRYLGKMNGGTMSKLYNSPEICAGIVYEGTGIKLNILALVSEVYNELFKNVRGNKFTIAVASSVPLYGIFIGLCAGVRACYTHLYNKWFNAFILKTTLKKINDLFIEMSSAKNAANTLQYGHVIYLLTVLKEQSSNVISLQKKEFEQDCSRLMAPDITALQKLEIVKNMRAYYQFRC